MKRRFSVVGTVGTVGLVVVLLILSTKAEAAPNGDVNGSGSIDISDGIYLLNFLFGGGPDPVPCSGDGWEGGVNGDVNGDGGVDLSDAIYLLNRLFGSGPELVPCKEPEPPHALRPFPEHAALAQESFEASCSGCHSMEPPSVLPAAPACTSCHAGGSPLVNTDCSSCHGNPPNGAPPVGEEFPNLPGAHAVHLALSSVDGDCDICHSGGGTGTGLQHQYDETVNLAARDATYDAKAGAIVFQSNRRCSNVSCHGGIVTPDWRTGSISLTTNAGCAMCHQAGSSRGDPEANSHYSGKHRLHRSEGIGCITCHNMSGDENHFSFLDTPEIEGPITYSNPQVTFNPSTRRCSGSCHGENHSGEGW